MCVDDYEFRHFSAQRDKVCRKFTIVNQEEFARTFFVNISQFEEHGHVALCKILIYLSTKGLNIEGKKFYIPKFNVIIDPFSFCKIKFQALDQKDIIMKTYPGQKDTNDIFAQNQGMEQEYQTDPAHSDQSYYCRFQEIQVVQGLEVLHHQMETQKKQEMEEERLVKMEEEESQERVSSQQIGGTEKSQQSHKKTKQSERGIGQVILAVKIWRQLHQSKRCNLTNAAKVVGISKKSLDDYYLVLRVGQILGFDYLHNLDKKMGDLRNYIRSRGQKVTGKLGKNVECFKLVPNMDLDQLIDEHAKGSSLAF